jgi:hypothetical protein
MNEVRAPNLTAEVDVRAIDTTRPRNHTEAAKHIKESFNLQIVHRRKHAVGARG